MRVADDGLWRTTTTPDGPATVRIARVGRDGPRLRVGSGRRRGPGRRCPTGWAPPTGPTDFDPGDHPVVADLHRRTPWLRLGRTGRTWDALVPAVLEQKVTTVEAHRVWRELLRLAGEPAPGPAPDGHAGACRRRGGCST